jgi:hypothetical protein
MEAVYCIVGFYLTISFSIAIIFLFDSNWFKAKMKEKRALRRNRGLLNYEGEI